MQPDISHKLAAKFRTAVADAPRYHPLACHMADVAAVALALWDECLPAPPKGELSAGLGLPDDEARRWVAFLAGLHDLGKASRPFQAKDANHSTRLAGTGLEANTNAEDPGHGIVTAAQLPALLTARGVAPKLSGQLATVLGGHHGFFPLLRRGQGERADIGEKRDDVRAKWDAARRQLFDELADVLKLERVPTGQLGNTAVMLLGGFVSIADWIGSIDDAGFFEYAPEGAEDLAEYFKSAQGVAARALVTLRWKAYPGATRRTFRDAFGYGPRPLHRRADELRKPGGVPLFVVIEAPMGEGKTEAALHLLEGWAADGAARGFYIALPTQATANQMHGRIKESLGRAFPNEDVNLVLAHGGAWLRDDLEHLPAGVYDDDAPRTGSVGAGEWFLTARRALLAPYGVGTIDQALMAVLQVKHVFVRLYGLAGKAVVIDEVHAYDTYMTGLLERLLEWLGALGSPVVLLSATLPASRRVKLAEAYRRGCGDADAGAETAFAAYPRITWLEAGSVRAESFDAAERSERLLALDRVPDSPEAVRDLLLKELTRGGCAAVICNTVARAQEMYRALKGAFEPHELGLFHARFLAMDRQAIETDCLQAFGPPGADGVKRPDRYVLVATQVVEQSLDVDFDVMVTDLAPVDLLLQRSGRLQRHERAGRPGGPPTLHIRWPEEGDAGPPELDRNSSYVYDEHILLRTWHALRNREAIDVPGNVQELVDLVYRDDEGVPEDADASLAARWRETWEALEEKKEAESREAKDRTVRTPVGSIAHPSDFQRFRLEEDSPELHPALQAVTRLAEPAVSVVLLPEGSPLEPKGSEAPDRNMVRELVGRSVSVSSRLAVPALFKLEPPPAFAASPALRRHRLLILDGNGETRLGDVRLKYGPEFGVSIIREGGQ